MIFFLQFGPDPSLPNWLCRNCLLEANVQLEYLHQISTNLMRSRITYFTTIGDHQEAEQLEYRLRQSRLRLIDESLINAPYSESDECSSTTNDSDISTINGSTPAESDNATMHPAVSSSTEPDDVFDLLIATREQLENISETESDGEREKATQQEGRHVCKICPKSYLHAKSLANHQRKHTAAIRAKNRHNPTFQCSEPKCTETFLTLKLLRSHKEKHKTTFTCVTCSETFKLKNALVWHSAECEAKQQVLNDIDAGAVDMRKPMRPRSRSLSFLGESSASSDISIVDSLHLQKMQKKANIYVDEVDMTESDTDDESSFGGSSNK